MDKGKFVEMLLRLYTQRIDSRPLYWFYRSAGEICYVHQGKIMSIMERDLVHEVLFCGSKVLH